MTSFSRCRSATRPGLGLGVLGQVADRRQDALELQYGLVVGAELAAVIGLRAGSRIAR